jgi:hypothetical protein
VPRVARPPSRKFSDVYGASVTLVGNIEHVLALNRYGLIQISKVQSRSVQVGLVWIVVPSSETALRPPGPLSTGLFLGLQRPGLSALIHR